MLYTAFEAQALQYAQSETAALTRQTNRGSCPTWMQSKALFRTTHIKQQTCPPQFTKAAFLRGIQNKGTAPQCARSKEATPQGKGNTAATGSPVQTAAGRHM